MDWSQIQAIFSSWGVVQWGIAAVIGALILGLDKQLVPLAKAAWAKVPALNKPEFNPADETLVEVIARLEDRRETLLLQTNLIADELNAIDKMLGVKRGE